MSIKTEWRWYLPLFLHQSSLKYSRHRLSRTLGVFCFQKQKVRGRRKHKLRVFMYTELWTNGFPSEYKIARAFFPIHFQIKIFLVYKAKETKHLLETLNRRPVFCITSHIAIYNWVSIVIRQLLCLVWFYYSMRLAEWSNW